MLGPYVAAGMEKADNLVGVRMDTGHVRAFETIAVDAAQSKIFKLSFAPVLSRNDVIYLEWRWVKRRRQLTIFATIPRSLPNPLNEIRSVQNCFMNWNGAGRGVLLIA